MELDIGLHIKFERDMLEGAVKELGKLFENEENVLVAYLFGSYLRGDQTSRSDIDIAILLYEVPKKPLEYYLHLINILTEVLGDDVDLTILNLAPPLLKFQIIKNGKIIYCRSDRSRINFEAKYICEYLDFRRAMERYDECVMKQILK
ncbi:nucleotidyltransferase domain-containing protein [Candidatus Bathyarchaeota archaeon]|nr:nucleotidyltransferase domain-containing protein [Candidatus Bathyarchaeota archaeon]